MFLEFITHIQEKGFLSTEGVLKALEVAFITWESCAYHDDCQITQMMEAYLTADFVRRYWADHPISKEEYTKTEILALTYEWYMCQYAPEHMEEMNHAPAAVGKIQKVLRQMIRNQQRHIVIKDKRARFV